MASIKPGAREMVQPYVPATGLETSMGPATLPSPTNERAGATPEVTGVAGTGSAGASIEALPTKSVVNET